jgi:hypothetical protein
MRPAPSSTIVLPDAGAVKESSKVTDETRWDEKAGLRAGCGVGCQVIDVLKAQIKGDRR